MQYLFHANDIAGNRLDHLLDVKGTRRGSVAVAAELTIVDAQIMLGRKPAE